ncbi:MAG: hypothetical protein AAFX06_05940 [Planctomycetota bacterium]
MNLRCCVVLLLTLVCCAGCLEQSVVIKVDDDGSAVVHVRAYAEELNLGFGDAKPDKKRKPPTEEFLNEVAAKMGNGVRFKELRESKNSSGWDGFEILFECEDVNQVELDLSELLSLQFEKTEKENTEEEPDKLWGARLRFKHDESSLTIMNEFPKQKAVSSSETQDPFAASDPIPSVNPIGMSIATSIVKRVRMGVFVQVDGMQSTTAKHHQGDLVTLNRIDGARMSDTAIFELLTLGQGEPAPARLQELADHSKGLDWDVQPTITVQR